MLTVKTSMRLQTTQTQLQETCYAQARCKRLLFKQNYKEKCLRLNTWYTI